MKLGLALKGKLASASLLKTLVLFAGSAGDLPVIPGYWRVCLCFIWPWSRAPIFCLDVMSQRKWLV